MPEKIMEAAVGALVESPFHRRAHWGDLDAFAEGILARGILQPIVVRERDGGYQISFGHRRHRAAKLAELATVPIIVREQTDEEVIDAQLVENAERVDAHPMDEAEAYEQLQDRGATLEQLALRFGKDKTYIRQRLKLCALAVKARDMFVAGDIDVDRAFLVARIPDAKQQASAAKTLSGEFYSRDLAQCREVLERAYMLTLRGAPFPVAAPDLVEAAGACTTCHKNTDAAPDLFSDVTSKSAMCTDAACFKKKTAAGYKRKVAIAKKAGATVLAAKDSKDLFYGKSLHSPKYVTPTSKPSGQRKTWRALLGEHAPPIVIAKDGTGAARELYERKAATAAAKKAGVDLDKFVAPGGTSTAKPQSGPAVFDPALALEARQNGIIDEVRAELDETLQRLSFDGRMLALTYGVASSMPYAADVVAKRRKLAHAHYARWGGMSKKIERYIADAGVNDLLTLAVEILLNDDSIYEGWQTYDDSPSDTQTFLQLLGVDVSGRLAELEEKAIEEARATGMEIKGEAPPPAPQKKPAKKTKKTKAKKGAQ